MYILDGITIAEDEPKQAWVICEDYVHVRKKPSRKSEAVGYADAGDPVMVGSKEQNGFVRCYGVGEDGIGWIHTGYLVYDEPVKVNRTAYSVSKRDLIIRRYIGGKKKGILQNLDEVMVIWWSEEWCCTDKGFVMTKWLEMDGV